jgi:hypothetical protein
VRGGRFNARDGAGEAGQALKLWLKKIVAAMRVGSHRKSHFERPIQETTTEYRQAETVS